MTETVEKKKATKVKILQSAHVECEPGRYAVWHARTEEDRAKQLESWCKEFNEFIRDHRHQDDTRVSVVRVVWDCCSACKAQWEPYQEDGKTICAACGTEIET